MFLSVGLILYNKVAHGLVFAGQISLECAFKVSVQCLLMRWKKHEQLLHPLQQEIMYSIWVIGTPNGLRVE